MNQNAPSRYRDEFNEAVDSAIKECSRKTGVTDLETVYRHLKNSASLLLKQLKDVFFEEQVRVIIQKRLKRCTVSEPEAAAQAMQDVAQSEFDFFEMEQFRGVTQRITYLEDKIIKYVEYPRSFEWQRLSSIAHLGSGIDADIARREAQIASNDFLRPLVKKYGDLPAEELVRLWLRKTEVPQEK